MAEKSMKPTVNLYFHELAFAKRQQRVGLEGNYMEHLYRYFEYLMQYTSTVDPEFELPYNFVLKQYADVVDIPPDPNVPTLVFLPLKFSTSLGLKYAGLTLIKIFVPLVFRFWNPLQSMTTLLSSLFYACTGETHD